MVTVPADFAAALDAEQDARRAFDGMSYSHQLRWVLSVEDAKTRRDAPPADREGRRDVARRTRGNRGRVPCPPPSPEPTTAVLVIARPVAQGDAEQLCERLQTLARDSGAEVIVCDVRALAADARSVDALARLQLTARRLGMSRFLWRGRRRSSTSGRRFSACRASSGAAGYDRTGRSTTTSGDHIN